jgi:hypothetical protein
MFVRKERGRNARKLRSLRVSFQTREAIPFPEITLIATVTWYSVTVRTGSKNRCHTAVETLHLL